MITVAKYQNMNRETQFTLMGLPPLKEEGYKDLIKTNIYSLSNGTTKKREIQDLCRKNGYLVPTISEIGKEFIAISEKLIQDGIKFKRNTDYHKKYITDNLSDINFRTLTYTTIQLHCLQHLFKVPTTEEIDQIVDEENKIRTEKAKEVREKAINEHNLSKPLTLMNPASIGTESDFNSEASSDLANPNDLRIDLNKTTFQVPTNQSDLVEIDLSSPFTPLTFDNPDSWGTKRFDLSEFDDPLAVICK